MNKNTLISHNIFPHYCETIFLKTLRSFGTERPEERVKYLELLDFFPVLMRNDLCLDLQSSGTFRTHCLQQDRCILNSRPLETQGLVYCSPTRRKSNLLSIVTGHHDLSSASSTISDISCLNIDVNCTDISVH